MTTPAINQASARYPSLTTAIITLVTSSDGKVAEVQKHLETKKDVVVRRVEHDISEFQPSDLMERLRFAGSYEEVAAESALQKMNTLINNPNIKAIPGLTIEDTSFFLRAWDGYPGILAASFFNGPKDEAGKRARNEKSPHIICNTARDFQDYRASFIVTFVTLVADSEGKLEPKVAQGVAEGYVPAQPRGNGWSFDVVFCPDPIKVAEKFGSIQQVAELRKLRDLKVGLPMTADSLGYLQTFSEKPEWKKIWSPRNQALDKLQLPDL